MPRGQSVKKSAWPLSMTGTGDVDRAGRPADRRTLHATEPNRKRIFAMPALRCPAYHAGPATGRRLQSPQPAPNRTAPAPARSWATSGSGWRRPIRNTSPLLNPWRHFPACFSLWKPCASYQARSNRKMRIFRSVQPEIESSDRLRFGVTRVENPSRGRQALYRSIWLRSISASCRASRRPSIVAASSASVWLSWLVSSASRC